MRSVLLTVFCLFSTAVFAEDAKAPDVTLTLTAAEQQTWQQVGPVLDACIGAAALRGDTASCKTISQYLANFAAKVAGASPVK